MDALTSGLSPDQFWSLSLRELWNLRQAEDAKARRAYNRDLTLAWQVERLSIMATQRDGGRKLPNLSGLLARDAQPGPRQPRTREEQRTVIYAISAATGVPVQRLKKNAKGQYETVKETGHAAGKRHAQARG